MKSAPAPKSRNRRGLHPDRDQLARFTRSRRQEAGPLLAHLLSCRTCREQALFLLEEPPLPAAEEPASADSPYDEDLWQRLDGTLRRAASDREASRRQSEAWLQSLEKAPLARKLKLVAGSGFQPWAVADRLLALARTPGAEQETWARVALALGPRLDSGSSGKELWRDFQAAARGALGEAHLGKGNLPEAEAHLLLAGQLIPLHDGTEERALLCRRLAHLRWEQNRLDEAVALLLQADQLAQDLADPSLRTEVLLDLGDLYFQDLAEIPRAREVYGDVLRIPRPPRWPPACLALQGWVRTLLIEQRAERALEILDSEGQRLSFPADSREGLALSSLRGRVLLALRRPAQGELAPAFRQLARLEAFGEAALAATAWLRAELAAAGPSRFKAALGEIALTAVRIPQWARQPLEKLIRTARAGQLSAPWLEAQEETLERTLARRRLPYRGAKS